MAEATSRSPAALAMMVLVSLAVLLLTPAIRPFRWSRLFWTYVVPLVPLAVTFDGVVSCLRIYTPEEMLALGAQGRGRGVRRAGRARATRGVTGPHPVPDRDSA